MIREVYAGSDSFPAADYVELQMWAAGQNFVGGHTINVYGPTGTEVANGQFPAAVPSGVNQATIIAATPEAESQFNFKADVELKPVAGGKIERSGGAACWESLDCVSWGSFSGSLPSPAGSPAAPEGIPSGMALRRSIARGCSTLLEASDDRDDSAGDFDVVFPNPRPNAITPTEEPCTSQSRAAQTTLRRKPAKRTRDRTPTFRFTSNDDATTFQCKVDGAKFRPCRSPFTARRLSFGKHTFRVRARGLSGDVDPSPAAYSFTVLR